MKIIDIEAWDRKTPYKNFVRYTNPIFSLAARLDVEAVYRRSKRTGRSFFADFLFLVTASLNRVESLRLRINEKGEVVLYDQIAPSFIVMQENGVIATCRTEFTLDYEAFYQTVRRDLEKKARLESVQEEFNRKEEPDVFYTTCLPWLDFVSMSNPYHYEDASASSIPRLSWGKFVEESDGHRRLTFDIAAHHALLDGKAICDGFAVMSAALEEADAFYEDPKSVLDAICHKLGIQDKL